MFAIRTDDIKASGNSTENAAPLPLLFFISMWPPSDSSMDWQIDRPIPSPVCLVVKNGSNSLSRSSGLTQASVNHPNYSGACFDFRPDGEATLGHSVRHSV